MITVTNPDDDGIYPLDCDTSIALADVKALLEADSSIPASRQALYFNGAPMQDDSKTLQGYGVGDGDLLLLRDAQAGQSSSSAAGGRGGSVAPSAPPPGAPRNEEEAIEQLRQQVLTDSNLMTQLRQSNPQLANAASSSPAEFARLLGEMRRQMGQVQSERARAEAELAGADEFDIDAQRRIEEAIQAENVMANMEHAMEYSPESFGRVHMLYVATEVNGVEVKAFVDSGAQSTIMSPECAERCGIMRLLDRRFAGIARGVGTAKILGRIHSAQIKLSSTLYLPCSFTIMEGKGVECLFGLDMLKRYQAAIDLRANALIINGESCRFLDEHELPDSAKEFEAGEDDPQAAARKQADAATSSGAGGQSTSGPSGSDGQSSGGFPGSGQSLGSTSSQPQPPVTTPARAPTATSAGAASSGGASSGAPTSAAPAARSFPAESIKVLQDLGASEARAKALLEAAGGNVEVAAGLLFAGN